MVSEPPLLRKGGHSTAKLPPSRTLRKVVLKGCGRMSDFLLILLSVLLIILISVLIILASVLIKLMWDEIWPRK